ncbi:MAG: NHLP family bacteriocin export ABC transporter peptidase/permease/ATPase subunit [Bacteroidaceae bacterium]|nr:NHLP family bacteriocin export ABC transporter peptidase/permease/ATPase subunit [Bacteroidaceae bacterium]
MTSKQKVVKVPVVMQMEAVECGAASLTMILAYYGKWLPLEEVREACGVSRDGSSAKSILKAARRYGLNASGYRTSAEGLNGMQPAIIHWNFEHFVVFRGFKNGKAYLNDPGAGPIQVPIEVFNKSFTGVAMEFDPSDAFVKGGHQTNIFSYIKKNMQGAGEAFWITFILTLIGAIVGIVTPLFTRIFYDEILSGRNSSWAEWFFILMATLAVFNFILVLTRENYAKRVAGSLAMKGNVQYIKHLLRLPMNFFSMRNVGDLQQRQHLNETITHSLVDVIAPQFINIALLILYLSLMLSYSVPLTIVGIVAAAINLITIQYLSNIRINMIRSMEMSEAKYFSATVSCIDNMESIKAAGAESGFFEYWSGLWARKFNITANAHSMQLRILLLPLLANGLVNTLVLILGTLLILRGELSIGMLMAFQGFMSAFITPVNQIVNANQTLVEMRSQMERVDDVMKYPEDHRGGNSKMAEGKLGGLVEMKHVTFGYSPLLPPLIEDFNMRIEPGKSVAFVGSSGCGKSTLAKLISGLYKPWSGEILFDGRPIDSISSEELTNSISVIDQNVVLFDDTVTQNIRMWDNSIEEFAVMMACNDAQIREDIMSRPEGFSTKIVKGGQNFSGGQKQRIEIATALAKEPSILIMDEATSALDPKTEDMLMTSLREMGPTQVIIAHRLSTIRDCDEIIVMKEGKVMQRGKHDELIAQEGLYRSLMESN